MPNPSPLRYPGGKFQLAKLITHLVEKAGATTYIEPFAGGAGVALDLLTNGVVDKVVINDSDRAIASIWKAMVFENEAFIRKVNETPVTIEEWSRQRKIYCKSSKYSLNYAFAAFFLNRANHSGILLSGPIGGMSQTGSWKIDARFNKDALIDRIKAVGDLGGRIKVYNRDVSAFITTYLPRYAQGGFVYFDPPYYRKGRVLYKNFFTHNRHVALCDEILNNVECPWVVSYDDVPEIRKIYAGIPCRSFSLNYSLANNGKGREIMYFSGGLRPTDEEIATWDLSQKFDV